MILMTFTTNTHSFEYKFNNENIIIINIENICKQLSCDCIYDCFLSGINLDIEWIKIYDSNMKLINICYADFIDYNLKNTSFNLIKLPTFCHRYSREFALTKGYIQVKGNIKNINLVINSFTSNIKYSSLNNKLNVYTFSDVCFYKHIDSKLLNDLHTIDFNIEDNISCLYIFVEPFNKMCHVELDGTLYHNNKFITTINDDTNIVSKYENGTLSNTSNTNTNNIYQITFKPYNTSNISNFSLKFKLNTLKETGTVTVKIYYTRLITITEFCEQFKNFFSTY